MLWYVLNIEVVYEGISTIVLHYTVKKQHKNKVFVESYFTFMFGNMTYYTQNIILKQGPVTKYEYVQNTRNHWIPTE